MLVRAETREEIERAVCERLVTGRYAVAWVGELDTVDGRVVPRARAGDDRGYLDARSLSLHDPSPEPAVRAVATTERVVVSNVADGLRTEPWRRAALERDLLSVASIPLVYNDIVYGVLTIYADDPDAFDDLTQHVLSELGANIAYAINAVERKNALLSGRVTELAFDITDSNDALSRLARRSGCTLEYRSTSPRSDGTTHLFVAVTDGDPADLLDLCATEATLRDARVVNPAADAPLVQLRLAEPSVASVVGEFGATLRESIADGSRARTVVDVPSTVDVRSLVERVRSTWPGAKLVARRECTHTPTAELGPLADALTDRQREVVEVAYHGGYFERPRQTTGAALAETLDLSPPTFHYHLRAAQRNLFDVLLDGRGR